LNLDAQDVRFWVTGRIVDGNAVSKAQYRKNETV
jgi:hypothetical protein